MTKLEREVIVLQNLQHTNIVQMVPPVYVGKEGSFGNKLHKFFILEIILLYIMLFVRGVYLYFFPYRQLDLHSDGAVPKRNIASQDKTV